MLLMGHLDVVPVEAGTDKEWVYPPFEGRIADGYIWGRGAMDDKASVFGILEAVEILLEEEFKPQQLTPGFAQPLPRQYFKGASRKTFYQQQPGLSSTSASYRGKALKVLWSMYAKILMIHR
jgi:hypothetical protein